MSKARPRAKSIAPVFVALWMISNIGNNTTCHARRIHYVGLRPKIQICIWLKDACTPLRYGEYIRYIRFLFFSRYINCCSQWYQDYEVTFAYNMQNTVVTLVWIPMHDVLVLSKPRRTHLPTPSSTCSQITEFDKQLL
jgi:hypothetical protein